jgi:DNA-binding transcriptional LysR family regulator
MSDISDMRVFACVVELGGFSAASENLEITPSAVSKIVSRLEDRLGVRLLHRTTRRISLTPERESFHLRTKEILGAIQDAEAEVSRSGAPQGRLRINSVVPFALHQIAPALPDFNARYS